MKNNIIKIIALILNTLFFGLCAYKVDYTKMQFGGYWLLFFGLVIYGIITYYILYGDSED